MVLQWGQSSLSVTTMANVIDVADLHKVFPAAEVHALQGVNFTAETGSLTAVTGASGSGKTTFMNILGLLDSPTSGTYQLCGSDTAQISEADRRVYRARKLGFVFQDSLLDITRTARANVELGLRFASVPRQERRDRALEALSSVNLSHRAEHSARFLSGGEKQRVAIARAVAHQPEVLLCDEPTGALDEQTSDTVFGMIRECASRGMTVVVVTHDMALAAACERVAKLRQGQIEMTGHHEHA